MPIFAISLMSIMAMVGATIALGMDSRSGNHLQHSADAAALGGATAFLNSSSPKADDRLKAARTQAIALAKENSEYSLSDFKIDAVTEDAYGQHTKLEVELQFEPVNYFAKFLGNRATQPIRRRAVAGATWGFPLCVLTLAGSGTGVFVSDNANLSAQNCIIWSNSDSRLSMLFKGGTSSSKAFCAVGKVRRIAGASVTPEPATDCQPLPDPLAGFDIPMGGLCDNIDLKIKKKTSATLSPGIYCGGINIDTRNVTFEPGIYLVRGGAIKVSASGVVDAQGVTFLLEGALNKVEIKGDSGLRIKAPNHGATAGIAFAQLPDLLSFLDPLLPPEFKLKGELEAEGVFYLPSFDMNVDSKGRGRTQSPYLQLVVNRLTLSGDGALNVDFDESETDLPIVIKPAREARLME